jgi:hypothetical protein
MQLFTFVEKLMKVEPSLYVHRQGHIAGIYKRSNQRRAVISRQDLQYATPEQQKFIEALAKGLKDQYTKVGVNPEFVPEYDVFDLETGRLVAPGWRGILVRLASRKFISLSRARKHFGCAGLGTNDFDKMGFEARLKRAQELEKGNQGCLILR